MIFKLTKRNLFLLVVAVLLLSHIGFGVKEYFDTNTNTNNEEDNVNGDDENNDKLSETMFSSASSLSTTRSALPRGIPKSEIPPGDEDLYILKSEVVPPVCPKCPDLSIDVKKLLHQKKCPPCPPCARCPEPAFECKKVPNYERAGSDDFLLPRPVLANFSQFGM
jgi:hypothetical protein